MKPCRYCGRPFEPKTPGSGQVMCSESCRVGARRKRNREWSRARRLNDDFRLKDNARCRDRYANVPGECEKRRVRMLARYHRLRDELNAGKRKARKAARSVAEQRERERTYRKNNRAVIKVARVLHIPRSQARAMLNEARP